MEEKMRKDTKMSDIDFEKSKLAEYVCNAISSANRKKEIEDLYEWFEDQGCEILGLKFVEIGGNRHRRQRNEEEISEAERIKQIQMFFKNAVSHLRGKYLKRKLTPSDCERTLNFIAKATNLTPCETEYLGLVVRYYMYRDIENFIDNVSNTHRFVKDRNCCRFLSEKFSLNLLQQAQHRMNDLGLTDDDDESYSCLSGFTKKLLNRHPKTFDQFQKIFLGRRQTASLKWEDFDYIEKRDELCSLLKAAVERKEKGINIIFYGIPGTGKTEFARTLARQAGVALYSVAENGDRDDASYRTPALMFAQNLAARQNGVCLLLDEAEDVFYGIGRWDMTKSGLNDVLERNETPVIWTTNRTFDMDSAFLRRFSYSIHFELPDEKHSVRIWQKALRKNKLPANEKVARELCAEYAVPPAFMANAVRNERLIGGGIETVKSSLDNMRELCTGKKKKKSVSKPVVPFNPALLNTDTDLEKLAGRIKDLNLKTFSLCLYGAPGTGKSAYAVWLAEQIGRPVIKKKCSDLLSMYVGGTEKNIREAFAEAAAKDAVLIFDEADSFLQDRRNAVRSWETTQVNEMLTQMESAEHPFVCTTNLLDRLDQASLRRFTFKVKYDFMTAEQRAKAFETFFGFKDVFLPDAENLTPADFALVHKKATILGVLNDKKELLKMLMSEQTVKAPPKFKLGF